MAPEVASGTFYSMSVHLNSNSFEWRYLKSTLTWKGYGLIQHVADSDDFRDAGWPLTAGDRGSWDTERDCSFVTFADGAQ